MSVQAMPGQPIGSAVDLLDSQLDRLDATIDVLASRLHIVSRDEDFPSANVTSSPRSPICGRVQRLEGACERIDRIIGLLDI